MLFAQLGRWWDDRDEIDLVGLWRSEVVLVGECKWTTATVGDRELFVLQRKAQKLPLKQSPLWVLASRSGFDGAVRRRAAAGELLLIEPDGMFG